MSKATKSAETAIGAAFEKAHFNQHDFEFYTLARNYLRDGGTVERGCVAVREAAVALEREKQISKSRDAGGGEETKKAASPHPKRGDDQNTVVREDHAAPVAAPPPVPDDQGTCVRDDHHRPVEGKAGGGDQHQHVREDQKEVVSAARTRTVRVPNKPRSLADVQHTNAIVKTIYEKYCLGGQPILGMTRNQIARIHAESIGSFRSAVHDTIRTGRDYVISDLMLKHCQADGSTTAERMFKPADLERFERKFVEMAKSTADVVSDMAASYLRQKTQEIDASVAGG